MFAQFWKRPAVSYLLRIYFHIGSKFSVHFLEKPTQCTNRETDRQTDPQFAESDAAPVMLTL